MTKGGETMAICAGKRARITVLSVGIIAAFVGHRALKAQDMTVKRASACMDYMFYDEAIALFDRILEKHPAERGIRVDQAYAYFRLNKYDEAAAILEREHELFPDDLKPLILLSLVQDSMGRPDEALATARAVQAELDGLLKRSGRKKAASALRALAPNAGLPAYLLGLDASRKRDPRTARSRFLRAQALGYNPMDCRLQAINAEIEAGNWDGALKLDETMKLGQNGSGRDGTGAGSAACADSMALKAIVLAGLGRRDECRASLEEALAAEPFRTDILMDLAVLDLERAEFEEAARKLAKAVKLAPLDFRARDLLGQAQARRTLPEGSRAAAFSRDFLKARGPRFVYVLKGQPEDAVSAVQTCAVDLIKRGLLADAARCLRMFTDISEGSASIYYNLGQLDNGLGRLAEALACGAKALRLKPDYRDAHDLMGNVYFKVGDFARAVSSYERAVSLDPRDPVGFFNLACAFHESGDDANAEINWLKALLAEKTAPAAGASARSDAGALDHSLTVKVEPVSAPCCEYLGSLYARQGKTAQAIDYYEKAIAFNREGLVPYLEIGKLYRAQNDPAKAREYFDKYLALGGEAGKIKER
jgi:tetratricopeptide (TPR) repeat protein